MPVAPRDPRWKTAEVKSQDVLDLNEDLNIIASKMKTLDGSLAKVYGKLRETSVDRVPSPSAEAHIKLGKAVGAVRTAYDKVEDASKILNEAAQYFES